MPRPCLMPCLVSMLTLMACQHSASNPDVPEAPFEATGEVQYLTRSAAFSATRIVGPTINLQKRTDGTWGGRLFEMPVDVNDYGDRIAGANFTMQVEQTAEGQIITGQWQGDIIRFELDNTSMRVRTSGASFTFPPHGKGQYGSQGQVQLRGQSMLLHPPFPQFAFAMLGTFLRDRAATPNGRVPGYEMSPVGPQNPSLGN